MGGQRTLERVVEVVYLPITEAVYEVLRLPANLVPIRVRAIALEALVGPESPRDSRRLFGLSQATTSVF